MSRGFHIGSPGGGEEVVLGQMIAEWANQAGDGE